MNVSIINQNNESLVKKKNKITRLATTLEWILKIFLTVSTCSGGEYLLEIKPSK